MTTKSFEYHVLGPLGSDFWQIKVPPELVPAMAMEIDWNRLGRRVMIDVREGIIAWMNPSGPHEVLGDASDKVIEWTGQLSGLSTRSMRGTRWKGPDDPKNTGIEADAAFYIGINAECWYKARRSGLKAVGVFDDKTPPDLVVEIEVTHLDVNKPNRYAKLGIREMWRVERNIEDEKVLVAILDLQADGGPQEENKSKVLEGLTTANLPQAFELAEYGQIQTLQNMLATELAISPDLNLESGS